MSSKGTVEKTSIYVIALIVFAFLLFTTSFQLSLSSSDAVKNELSKEISDRVFKSLIVLSTLEKGTARLEFNAPYRVCAVRESRNFVIVSTYDDNAPIQSKSFDLPSGHTFQVYGSGKTENGCAKEAGSLVMRPVTGEIRKHINPLIHPSMESICIVKLGKNYWLFDPQNSQEYLGGEFEGESIGETIDGADCSIKV